MVPLSHTTSEAEGLTRPSSVDEPRPHQPLSPFAGISYSANPLLDYALGHPVPETYMLVATPCQCVHSLLLTITSLGPFHTLSRSPSLFYDASSVTLLPTTSSSRAMILEDDFLNRQGDDVVANDNLDLWFDRSRHIDEYIGVPSLFDSRFALGFAILIFFLVCPLIKSANACQGSLAWSIASYALWHVATCTCSSSASSNRPCHW